MTNHGPCWLIATLLGVLVVSTSAHAQPVQNEMTDTAFTGQVVAVDPKAKTIGV
jgi:hypothetical protein